MGYTADELTFDSLKKFGFKKEVSVHKGDVIFPRIDAEKELAAIAKEEAEKKAARLARQEKEQKEEAAAPITIEDFAKVNLIVGEVKNSVPVEKSDKLLNNTIFDGKRERTILSGIRQWYSPEDLIGKKVIIVDNLAPRKMRGLLSEGMLLAADMPDGSAKVIFADDSTPAGSKIR